jgi:serine/threonine protein kinase
MSDVFLAATDEQTSIDFTKLVVLKKLREEHAQDFEFVTMFMDEARIAARLNHPNVIQTLEVGQTENDFFLAMEYLEGQPLSRILNVSSFGMPLGMHLTVVAETLGGVHYAHELKEYDGTLLNIVHRDVTPHNIFVTYNGQVKVMDFGIAKAAGRAAETRYGVVKGKVGYMAPEQVSLQPMDRRADVFALGVVLYEAATRSRMWAGVPQHEVLKRLMEGKHPTSPKAKRPGVHEELDRICRKALAFDPNERYPTAAALQEELETFIADHERRPSPRQLGAFVSKLFGQQQEQARKVIQDQLSDLLNSRRAMVTIDIDVDSETSIEDPSIPASTEAEVVPEAPSQRSDAFPQSQQTPSAVVHTEPSRSLYVTGTLVSADASRRRLRLLVTLGLIVALPLAIMVVAMMRETGAVVASDAKEAETVTLTLRATPLEARFKIDDGPSVDNPYVGKLAKDKKVHFIRAEAPGFLAKSEEVHFDRDVSMRFALGRAAADQ